MYRKHNNDEQKNLKIPNLVDWRPRLPEKLGSLAKPILTLLLLAGPGYVLHAQEGVATEVPSDAGTHMEVGSGGVNLRNAPERTDASFVEFLQPGTDVLIGATTQNEGYTWGQVLAIEVNGEWVRQPQTVYIALEGHGQTFATEVEDEDPTPEAEAAPVAPTEAPVATQSAVSTEAAPQSTEQIIDQAERAMNAIGVENPHFSGPMEHDGLITYHLDNSTYYLGRFNTTNGDYLVSYCAPVAVATQAAYSGNGEIAPVVANGLVEEYQYSTSTAVMAALGDGNEATIHIGGVQYQIERWGMGDESIEDHIDDLAIGDSTVVVFRDVGDTSHIGHLVTIQRVAENRYVITQSNTRDGMFFRDATNTSAANGIGAGNGGVFITIGDAENVSNYVDRIASWYYATGIAGMVPVNQ